MDKLDPFDFFLIHLYDPGYEDLDPLVRDFVKYEQPQNVEYLINGLKALQPKAEERWMDIGSSANWHFENSSEAYEWLAKLVELFEVEHQNSKIDKPG